MNDEKIISFPNLGDYYVPISYLLEHVSKYKVMIPNKTSKKTIELGSKYSPDFVCIPFKYNLGNFIESLENGANIILQAGGGCRYGYYSEVQEKILKDLGYDFKMYSLVDYNENRIKHFIKTMREMDESIKLYKLIYYSIISLLMIFYMDKNDEIIRSDIGFEVEKNSFNKVKNDMLNSFKKSKGIISLTRNYFKYRKRLKRIKVNKPTDRLKVGIIGELYTAMEGYSTYFLEEELAKMNIEIKRFTNLSYLLFFKKYYCKYYLRKIRNYCTYPIGADGMDNVYRVKWLKDNNYDGIIHTKPFGCTPEITAIPIIDKISHDLDIPIVYFSYDEKYSEVGMKTRLEAFYDLIKFRKEG